MHQATLQSTTDPLLHMPWAAGVWGRTALAVQRRGRAEES